MSNVGGFMSTQTFSLDQLVGKNLQGYVIQQLLRLSKLNAVYMAQQEALLTVLLTVFLLPADLSAEGLARFRWRFMETAGKLAVLDHPHILPLYAYGEEYGYPYLITPSPASTTRSLAHLLRQQGPFPPEQTLELLQQIAAALDYARLQGVVHGSLESTHILLDHAQNIQLTNFGLMHMLSLHDIEEDGRPYAHLFSLAGSFLGAPEYMAPEVVEGTPPDERSDIYALGVLLYELLSGTLPFTGEDPMAIAFEHIDQSIPPLHTLPLSLSGALDRVIQQCLERDPALRFQTAGKLVAAFEQALRGGEQVKLTSTQAQLSLPQSQALSADVERREQTGSRRGLLSGALAWQTGSLSSTDPSLAVASSGESGGWQLRPPIITNHLAAVKAVTDAHPPLGEYPPLPAALLAEKQPGKTLSSSFSIADQNTLPGITPEDEQPRGASPLRQAMPFVREPAMEQKFAAPLPGLPTPMMANVYRPLTTPKISTPPPVPGAVDTGRRKTLALMATGGAVTLGLIGLGGISLAQITQGQPVHIMGAAGGQTDSVAAPQKKKVIGQKRQPLNTAVKFTNLADQQASLLIHLPNGNFVAYESACTHEAVAVVYDTKRHLLVCPKHNSTFDPAAGGKALNGPATAPLKSVKLQINADGSISTA
jgi:serine/threonine protein kinase/nitrite reductase/ring-hydroxylating ferredoxin subunit